MLKIILFIVGVAVLSACQTTPKFAPSATELEGKLQGLAQAGYDEVKCDITTPEFDEAGVPFRQDVYRRQFGREFTPEELVALKSYDWKISIDEQTARVQENKTPNMPNSDQVGEHVRFARNELRYAAEELSSYYFDLLLDIKDLKPQLVPGGYLYTTAKGRQITVSADFSKITNLYGSQGNEIERVVELGTVNGFRVPQRLLYTGSGGTHRTIFYVFDDKSNPPKPKEIIVGFGGSDASSRSRYRFANCQFEKVKK